MSIIEQARDALKDSTPGPWRLNERNGRTFQSHIIVEPHRGAQTICEMTDVGEYSAELVSLAPELAAAVVRAAEMHAPVEIEPSETICHECSWQLPSGKYFGKLVEWPCPTLAALEGETDE